MEAAALNFILTRKERVYETNKNPQRRCREDLFFMIGEQHFLGPVRNRINLKRSAMYKVYLMENKHKEAIFWTELTMAKSND
jgi:hypothetical protein